MLNKEIKILHKPTYFKLTPTPLRRKTLVHTVLACGVPLHGFHKAELVHRVVPQVCHIEDRVLVKVVVKDDARGPPQCRIEFHNAHGLPLFAEELKVI